MTSPVPIENDLDHGRNKKVAIKVARLLSSEFGHNIIAAIATSIIVHEVLVEVFIGQYGQEKYDKIFKGESN